LGVEDWVEYCCVPMPHACRHSGDGDGDDGSNNRFSANPDDDARSKPMHALPAAPPAAGHADRACCSVRSIS
jgi:hypothetical protein